MVRRWIKVISLAGLLLATAASTNIFATETTHSDTEINPPVTEVDVDAPVSDGAPAIAATDEFKLKAETSRSNTNGFGAATLQMTLGLVLVLGLIVGLSWLARRFNLGAPGIATNMKVVGAMNLGSKEKILVLEVDNQRLLIGVTSQQITLLQILGDAQPAPENRDFANRMQALLKAGTLDEK